MTIYFSEVFKKLRKEHDLTQEQIADIIGVSPQAVSRWECDTTYPDISILPIIAEFFNVSIDELLGTQKSKLQKKVHTYNEALKDAFSKGLIYDCIDLMRAAVKEFPNNYHFLNKLMYVLFVSGDDSGNILEWEENIKKYDAEIIEIGERILKYCTDDAIRLEAKSRLAFHYCETNRKAKALELINTLPSQDSCREAILYRAIEGTEREAYLRERIEDGLGKIWFAITAYSYQKKIDPQTQINWLTKQMDILNIIYENKDYGEWYYRLARLYGKELAKLYIQIEDYENALGALEKGVEYAIAFEKMPQEYSHTSPLLVGLTTSKDDWEKSDTRNLCRVLLEEVLTLSDFDVLRNEQRFQKLEASLKEYLYTISN
ncbi:MAG: helix-turn-helix domain-containing protein [Cellulosilyticaceae bacterium]